MSRLRFIVVFFNFVLVNFNTVNAQTKIIFTGHIMPSVLISTEKFYFEYFGEKIVQPTIQYRGRIGLEFNNRWLLFAGLGFHKRKMSTDCLLIPEPGVHVVQGSIPIVASSTCTHTVTRDYTIIDIPILLGYKFQNEKKLSPYILAGFSPYKRVSYTEIIRKLDTGEIFKASRAYSSELYYLFYSYLSIGVNYSVTHDFEILCEFVYRIDDKKFRDHTLGLSFGVNYRL